MTISHLIDLANDSGGTLYLMIVLLTVALTVIIERSRYLSNMLEGGQQLIRLLKTQPRKGDARLAEFTLKNPKLPHLTLINLAHDVRPVARLDRESMV